MKQIRIKSIEMHYFKGILSKMVEFGEGTTRISAPNGAGKSTIVDAFHWCLWGKNAQGDQKFTAKTLDKNGVEIPHVNHEVTVVLEAGDEAQTFRRVLVPEYDGEDQLKGNHTDYYWNDVPLKKSEYDVKVGELIKENVFKLITSPYAFLELDWQKQRETLMRMAGEIRNEEVKGEFSALLPILKQKSLEEIQKEISSKLKRVNDSMMDIPARIDEVKRGMPQLPDMDSLKAEKEENEKALEEIEQISKSEAASIEAKNKDRNELLKKMSDLQFQQSRILNDAQAKERNEIHQANARFNDAEQQEAAILQEEKADSTNCDAQHRFIKARIANLTSSRQNIEKQLAELRDRWRTVNSQTFTAEEYLKCPLYGHNCQDGSACAQYDQNQGAAFGRFCEEKDRQLGEINAKGAELKTQLQAVIADLEKCDQDILNIKQDYEKRNNDRIKRAEALEKIKKENPKRPLLATIKGEDIPEWLELGLEIASVQSQLEGMTEHVATGNEELQKRRAALMSRLYDIKVEMSTTARIEEAEKRVAQLEEELQKLGIQKTELEMMRQQCRDFEVAKMNMITDKVNHRFRIVRWQMFQRQVNGEEVPACVCLCGGVPWADANDAAKLNAGIDVAYTLSQASSVSAPMFIDGAEKSTNIYNPGGQRILLKVEDCREMTITNN